MATKMTVTTPEGTFTRKTVRIYTHIVVVGQTRQEIEEPARVRELARWRKNLADTEALASDPVALAAQAARYSWYTQKFVDDQLAHVRKNITRIEAPITTDGGKPSVFGWCGRLDLAQKLAVAGGTERFRTVSIYTVAGELVSKRTNGQAPKPAERCGHCGGTKPADRSCDCFDNGCQ